MSFTDETFGEYVPKSDNPDWILRYYPTVKDAVDDAVKRSKTDGASHTSSDGWAGATWREAIDLGRNGWDAVRPKVDAILTPVRDKLATILDVADEPSFDIMGFEPDIDRYLANEVESMREYMPVLAPAKGKVFNLLIDGCFNSGVSADKVFRTGAAIAALVESMQILGFDMNIYVETNVEPGWSRKGDRGTWKNYCTLTRVHRAGENLDINNVMFPIGHPGWLRRIVFSIQEGESKPVRDHFGFHDGNGYGRPVTAMCDDLVEASFIMSLAKDHRLLYDNPVEWVLSQLEAQGVWERES